MTWSRLGRPVLAVCTDAPPPDAIGLSDSPPAQSTSLVRGAQASAVIAMSCSCHGHLPHMIWLQFATGRPHSPVIVYVMTTNCPLLTEASFSVPFLFGETEKIRAKRKNSICGLV